MTSPSSPPAMDPRAEAAARLALRIRDGDSAAEGELVERYRRGLVIMLRELSRDPVRAEDLAQETLQRALVKLRAGELRELEKLPGFLRGMARNLLLAERRKFGNRPMPDVDQVPSPVDPSPSPEAAAWARQNADLVRRLLSDLEPPRDREILVRYYLRDETREQICSDLSLSRVHFNRVIYRARERFRKLLEASGYSDAKGSVNAASS